MAKEVISATVDKEIADWIKKELKDRTKYRNRSHLIEIALESLRSKDCSKKR